MPIEEESFTWRESLRDLGEFVVELLKVVLISLAIIIPIRYYVVQPFYVKGASMTPAFLDREYLLVDEISYRFFEPDRKEVVVFRYPKDLSQYFIKRIIGLPGETVKIANGEITIINNEYPDGFKLDEEYLRPALKTVGEYKVEVPKDQYFLLGDNRSASLDSRVFGPVAARYLVGRVWLRAWPFDRWAFYGAEDIPGI